MTIASETVEVRRAAAADGALVSEILVQAFFDDPVTSWAFPDDDRRREPLPDLFSVFVDGLLAAGEVRVTEDGIGAALWMPPVADAVDEDPNELVRPLQALAGADAERFLEATSERSKKLYERHGFEAIGQFAPIGAPPLWPMWRSPR